jgi:hypothetical protein
MGESSARANTELFPSARLRSLSLSWPTLDKLSSLFKEREREIQVGGRHSNAHDEAS